MYRYIKCPHALITPASFESNLTFSIKLFSCLVLVILSACFFVFFFVFILYWGDVYPNPGPGSDNDLADVSQSNSNESLEMLSNHLSIFQSQSRLPKIDLLGGEAEAYDILVFPETRLKPVIENDTILIENFCHLSGKAGVTVLAEVLPYT